MVITYSCEELLGLCSRDVKPVRAVRKSIFRHQLWQPAFVRWLPKLMSKQTNPSNWQRWRIVSAPTSRRSPTSALRAVGRQLFDRDRCYSQRGTLWRLSSAHGNVAHVACGRDAARPSTDPSRTNYGGVAGPQTTASSTQSNHLQVNSIHSQQSRLHGGSPADLQTWLCGRHGCFLHRAIRLSGGICALQNCQILVAGDFNM